MTRTRSSRCEIEALFGRIRPHPACPQNNPQYGEAQRHLEAHQEEPSFLLALAYVLAQTTPDQVL